MLRYLDEGGTKWYPLFWISISGGLLRTSPAHQGPHFKEERVRSSHMSRRPGLRVAQGMLATSLLTALSIATVATGTAGAASGGGLGAAHPATGTPVTVGVITDGGSG